jgi:hypothetical protein
MTDHEPASMELMVPGATTPTQWWATTPTPWATARAHLEDATATYWLATVRPNGAPHVMPVMAVWVDGRLFFSAGERTRKARNLARDSRCVVTVEDGPVDLVVEGDASIVRDDATLARLADAFASIHGWRVTVRDGAFHHDTGGAPTAGPPPYDAYEVTPTVAFGLPLDEKIAPTRWRFREPPTGG